MTQERAGLSFLTRFVRRPSHRRIIANTAWLFVDKVVYAAVGIFVGVWVARYLQPASFGLYSYAMAIVGFLVPVAGLGLKSIVVRNIVREPAAKEEILGTMLILRFGASLLLVTALVAALACGIGPQDKILRWLIAIMSVQLIFSAFGNTVTCWFESQLQSKYIVWARNSAAVLAGLLKVGLILVSAQVIAFGIATAVQVFIFACGSIVLYQLTGNRLSSLRGNVSRAKQLLADSWPLMFSGLAIVIHMRIDQIMLGHLADSKTLGIYSVAVRLSELWFFVPVAVAVSLFPAIVRSRENHTREVYGMRMQAFFDMMAGMAYVIAVPLTLIALPLVIALFGVEYAEAGPILRVHIWALVFVSLGVARGRRLLAENLVPFAMFTTVLGVTINIGFNVLLIPKFGGMGAAWATLFSQAAASYLSSLLYVPLWGVFRQATLALLVPLRLPSLLRSLRDFGFGRP
ncbi:flippase [bacterium]|nr:flippase [bacterium]